MSELSFKDKKFIEYLLLGYSRSDAYNLSHPLSNYHNNNEHKDAEDIMKKPAFKLEWERRQNEIKKRLEEKVNWNKEIATNELLNLLTENKKELQRYNDAFVQEVTVINNQIEKLKRELTKPNKTKREKEEIEKEIYDNVMLLSRANRRHLQSRAVNEGILQAINQINTMFGIDKPSEVVDTTIHIKFDDDLTNDDE